jgi:flagellum-specific peptidoglycan hydrolase FlgJ
MATTTVEILGGQLDGAVINNAASEATLQAVVSAIQGMSGGGSGGGGGPGLGGGGNPAANIAKLEKSIPSFTKGIGNVIGAAGAFAGLIASGNDKLSSYTDVLNKQVISKIPVLGGLLGGLGGAITATIEVFEGWNDQLKSSSKVGASFNNSIIELRQAAAGTNLDLDKFVGVIRKHSKDLISLGGTVTAGAKVLSDYNRELYKGTNSMALQLMNMGFSAEDITDGLASYSVHIERATQTQIRSAPEAAASFMAYQKNLAALRGLTGKQIDQIEQQMATATQNIAFQMALNKLEPAQRNAMMQALARFTADFGEAGADMFASMYLGMAPATDAGQMLSVLMPEASDGARKYIAAATQRGVDDKKFHEKMIPIQAEYLAKAVKSGQKLEDVIKYMGLSGAQADELKKALEPIQKRVLAYGDKTGDLTTQIQNILEDNQKALDKQNELTEFLNSFSIATGKLKTAFLDAVLPALTSLSESLKDTNFAESMRKFGVFLGQAVKDYLPGLIKSLEYLGSKDGRQYLLNELTNFLDIFGVRLKYAIRRMLGIWGGAVEDEEKEIKAIREKNELEQLKTGKGQLFQSDYKGAGGEKISTTDTSAVTPAKISAKGKEYYNYMYDALLKAAKAKGLENPEVVARLGAAQTSLETGYGAHMVGNNAFGIKAASGPGTAGKVTAMTTEYENGKYVKKPQEFRAYKDVADSAQDYIDFLLKNKRRYSDVLASKDVDSAITAQGRTGYASDPEYAKKLKSIIGGSQKNGMSGGTLGTYGRLFANFGTGTEATLHGQEAVLTPDQLTGIMATGGDTSLAELVHSLNSNLSTLVQLTSDKLILSGRHLSAIESQTVNIH